MKFLYRVTLFAIILSGGSIAENQDQHWSEQNRVREVSVCEKEGPQGEPQHSSAPLFEQKSPCL